MPEQEQGTSQEVKNRGDFVTLIAGFREGREAADLTRELDKLAKAVLATGKKGTQTIKITLAEDDEESGRLSVEIDHEIKVPRQPRTEYLYAKRNTGELVRDNPETEAMLGRGLFGEGDEQ